MTDLVERLREITPDVTGKSYFWGKQVKEAADEIERLRAEITEQHRLNAVGTELETMLLVENAIYRGRVPELEKQAKAYREAAAEIERLRARVAELEAERRRPCGDEQDCIWQPRCGMARRCLRPSGGLIAPIESAP